MYSTSSENDAIIGIVGGMGPQAGLALFESVMRHTEATIDQQHLSAILMSFPGRIADRTAFLEGETSVNPAFYIAEVIRKLERAGASIIGISCNTSHAPRIFNVITRELQRRNSIVQVLNMPLETCACIREKYPYARRIGLMTTNGTYRCGIYQDLLSSMGFEVIAPDPSFQQDVIHKIIYDREFGLKANAGRITDAVRSLEKKTMQYFQSRGADLVIFGCTDLSVLLSDTATMGMAVVDSTESLARALVRKVKEAKILS